LSCRYVPRKLIQNNSAQTVENISAKNEVLKVAPLIFDYFYRGIRIDQCYVPAVRETGQTEEGIAG